MKERAIKIGILSAVFIAAMILFGYLTNRNNAGVTADMDAPTFPTISFQMEGQEVNHLIGHKREMNVVQMRDTIAVYGETGELTLNLHYHEGTADFLKYELYSSDGKEILYEGEVNDVEQTVQINMGDVLEANREGILKLILSYEDGELYYYTRVIQDQDYHIKECLEYVHQLHADLRNKENEEGVKKVMEPNAEGDNSTLYHVNIHSDLTHVMWGDLKPHVVNGLTCQVKEINKAYMSVQLIYQVQCEGDNNEKELYNVKEFFKVAYGTERMYLYEYDRTMEEVFDTSNIVLSAKGIILGIAKENLPYKVNKDGTIVSFIQANELWSYHKEKNQFTSVFGFASDDKTDGRNRTDEHSIQLLSMEEDGNMTFSVCGYMNRGTHEGESGVAVYYYNMAQNSVEEKAFVPSTSSHLVIEEELSELAYYSKEQNVLYVMVGGTLKKIDMNENQTTIVVDGLQEGQYVTSDDGHLLAYQYEKDGQTVTELWDLAKDNRKEIPVTESEMIVPLGFVGSDFVYGVTSSEYVGTDASGVSVSAMSRLEIRDTNLKLVKTYEQSDVYILGVNIDYNQITIRQGVKSGTGYREIAQDYITNNETSANEFVELKSYWTDLKQTQYRLLFTNGIRDKKYQTLKAKQIIQEVAPVLEFENIKEKDYYYVYGHGKQAGVFEEAGEAVALASELAGVVVSSNQNYLWEAHNRVAWYHNFNVSAFTTQNDESTLAACVRKVLAYEGKSVDVVQELRTKSPEQVISEQLSAEAVRFRGCSVKDMFYLIDKGVPVIALKDSTKAVLLVGYDAKTVTYIDPSNGGTYTSSIEKMNQMLEGSGGTFVGYVK